MDKNLGLKRKKLLISIITFFILDLLWPSDKEDKITRQFYKDLSNLSKNINYSKKKKLKLFEQVVRIIRGKGWG